MTAKILTQNEILKNHFKRYKTLTQRDATIHLGVMRLSERVREIEKEGWQFAHNMVKVPSRFGTARVAEYELLAVPEAA